MTRHATDCTDRRLCDESDSFTCSELEPTQTVTYLTQYPKENPHVLGVTCWSDGSETVVYRSAEDERWAEDTQALQDGAFVAVDIRYDGPDGWAYYSDRNYF